MTSLAPVRAKESNEQNNKTQENIVAMYEIKRILSRENHYENHLFATHPTSVCNDVSNHLGGQ